MKYYRRDINGTIRKGDALCDFSYYFDLVVSGDQISSQGTQAMQAMREELENEPDGTKRGQSKNHRIGENKAAAKARGQQSEKKRSRRSRDREAESDESVSRVSRIE